MARWSRNRFLKNSRSRDVFDVCGDGFVGAEVGVRDCDGSEDDSCAKARPLIVKTEAMTRVAAQIQDRESLIFHLTPYGVTPKRPVEV